MDAMKQNPDEERKASRSPETGFETERNPDVSPVTSDGCLRRLVERSPVPMIITEGPEERVSLLNRKFIEEIGYTIEEVPDASHWWPLAYPDPAIRETVSRQWRERMARAVREQIEVEPLETPIRCKDGSTRIFRIQAVSVGSRNLSVFVDLTELHETQDRLKESRRTYQTLFARSPDGILLLDEEDGFVDCNPAAVKLLGYDSKKALLGRHPAECSPERQPDGRLSREVAAEKLGLARQDGSCRFEWVHLTSQGELTWIEVILTVIPLEGHEMVQAVWRDINERKRTELELQHRATHDALTGIYNRDHLYQQLVEAEARFRRYAAPFSLILMDVDHFKAVNDRHGHTVGDRVLKTLVQRIQDSLRESDVLGRWGGEEFLVLAPETDAGGALELAERIRLAVADTRFPDAGHITVSLGVAACRRGASIDTLIVEADRAMYLAKEQGRNQVQPSADTGTPIQPDPASPGKAE